MNRYLLWSVIFHVAIVLGGAGLAPMRGTFTSSEHSQQIISVGLVDMPKRAPDKVAARPQLRRPVRAADAEVAIKPESDLTREVIEEPVEPLPEKQNDKPQENKPEDKPKEPVKTPTKTDPGAESATQLAEHDTLSAATGVISDGGGGDDIWGIEDSPNMNPYHRRGFAAIRSNWRNPAVGPSRLLCTVAFRVLRSGEFTDITLEKSSGSELFDRSAVRAVQRTRSWDQFPQFWTDDEQIIHLEFEYRP